MSEPRFISTKTYTHSVGLTACFRQWRAESHCQFLHGYALQIQVKFVEIAGLDARNWVVDFGSLKPLKAYLEKTFDHKTVVAADDPKMDEFQYLETNGLIQLTVLPNVGCEAFADTVYKASEELLRTMGIVHAEVHSVEVREHEGNSSIAYNPKYLVA